MAKVTVYTMGFCPYCEQAKTLLKRRGVDYDEVRVPMDDDAQWNALYQRSKMRTMPQIFVGDRLVGGFNELAELDKSDSLASLK